MFTLLEDTYHCCIICWWNTDGGLFSQFCTRVLKSNNGSLKFESCNVFNHELFDRGKIIDIFFYLRSCPSLKFSTK